METLAPAFAAKRTRLIGQGTFQCASAPRLESASSTHVRSSPILPHHSRRPSLQSDTVAREIVINSATYETRVALLEKQRLIELFIERARDKGVAGNIYKGRVTRVLPGMQAAFVDIGLGKAAFLHGSDLYA